MRTIPAAVPETVAPAKSGGPTFVNTRGKTWTYELWRMIVHLLQHQSYHRGQVTALFRQLGVPPPKVDFLDAHDMEVRC